MAHLPYINGWTLQILTASKLLFPDRGYRLPTGLSRPLGTPVQRPPPSPYFSSRAWKRGSCRIGSIVQKVLKLATFQ